MKKELITVISGIFVLALCVGVLKCNASIADHKQQQYLKYQQQEYQREVKNLQNLLQQQIQSQRDKKLQREKEIADKLEKDRRAKLYAQQMKNRNVSHSFFLKSISNNPTPVRLQSRPEFGSRITLIGRVSTIRPNYVMFVCQYVDLDAFMEYSTINVQLKTNDVAHYNKGELWEFSGIVTDLDNFIFTNLVLTE